MDLNESQNSRKNLRKIATFVQLIESLYHVTLYVCTVVTLIERTLMQKKAILKLSISKINMMRKKSK